VEREEVGLVEADLEAWVEKRGAKVGMKAVMRWAQEGVERLGEVAVEIVDWVGQGREQREELGEPVGWKEAVGMVAEAQAVKGLLWEGVEERNLEARVGAEVVQSAEQLGKVRVAELAEMKVVEVEMRGKLVEAAAEAWQEHQMAEMRVVEVATEGASEVGRVENWLVQKGAGRENFQLTEVEEGNQMARMVEVTGSHWYVGMAVLKEKQCSVREVEMEGVLVEIAAAVWQEHWVAGVGGGGGDG